MAVFNKIQSLTPAFQMAKSQDPVKTSKLILMTIIIFWLIPQISSRPMLLKKCPPTSTLDSGFVQEFRDKTQIDLSSCNIQNITPGAFDGMIQLQNLSLAGNNLDHLGTTLFRGCGALSTIDLSNNHLKFFPNSSFLQSTSIKQLIMKNNGITHIYPTTLQDLPHLEALDLRGNPVCQIKDCEMKSTHAISRWLHSKAATISDILALERKSNGTMMKNASFPGMIAVAKESSMFRMLSAIVLGALLTLTVFTVIDIYKCSHIPVKKHKRIQKIPDLQLDELEEQLRGTLARTQELEKKLNFWDSVAKNRDKYGLRTVNMPW